jgi:GDP/UDP-N,N'-diacetylbacillosamine 2-epimerase (hydrolysing)
MTINDINSDNYPIACCINLFAHDDTNLSMAHSVGNGIGAFADFFVQAKPSIVLVLGDRYEIFAAACAAVMIGIPLAHIHGGETTQGAIDEYFRHAITKMSALHFVAAQQYADRIIRMGEQPDVVFNVGSLGIENIRTMKLMSRIELGTVLGFPLEKPYVLVTYHPETLSGVSAEKHIEELFLALETWISKGNLVIITKANADSEGQKINDFIDMFAVNNPSVYSRASLGALWYLSAMKHCMMVVGNSSSGIIEAPTFGTPTINIGDRQKGRLMAESIICCNPDAESIIKAMDLASSAAWRKRLAKILNPYGSADTSHQIVDILVRYLISGSISIKKDFYDS